MLRFTKRFTNGWLRRAFFLGLLGFCLGALACRTAGSDIERDEGAGAGQGSGPFSRRDGGKPVQKTRIVFFGDSITKAGVRPEGYVTLVAEELKDAYPDRQIRVIAKGVAGDAVPDLKARLERDVLSQDPTHVVVYVGVNDVGRLRSVSKAKDEDKQVYREGLREIVSAVKAAGAEVVLCTPAVFGDDPASRTNENRLLDDYAAMSREVASLTGARLCDLRAAFVEYLQTYNVDRRYQGIVTVDGVHLNDRGNRIVADEILRVLDLS